MSNINKTIHIGRIGKDPDVRTLENGTQVAKFSLATTKSYKDKSGEWQEDTQWHTVIAWRYLAEKVEKLKQGMQVYVEGELTYRKWHKEGEETARTYTEIVATNIQNLTPKEKSDFDKVNTSAKIETTTVTNSPGPGAQPGPGEDTDDLPF